MNFFTRLKEKYLLPEEVRNLVQAYREDRLKVCAFDRFKSCGDYSPGSRITFFIVKGNKVEYVHVTPTGYISFGRLFNSCDALAAGPKFGYLFYIAAKDEERKIRERDKRSYVELKKKVASLVDLGDNENV